MNDQRAKDRFQELLPWHVNGTLSAAQREWVLWYLREHPETTGELRWYESLRDKILRNAPEVSSDVGWRSFAKRIRDERRAAAPSIFARIGEWLASMHFTPAFAAAAAVILAQAAIIGALLRQSSMQDDLGAARAIPAASQAIGPVIQINFKPEASERDMRMLLMEIEGSLVGGPGQLGNYVVRVPADRTHAAAKKLESSPLVDVVMVLPRWPQKSE
jgi:hypothetical protein